MDGEKREERGRFSGRRFRVLSSMLSVAIIVRASRFCDAVFTDSDLNRGGQCVRRNVSFFKSCKRENVEASRLQCWTPSRMHIVVDSLN